MPFPPAGAEAQIMLCYGVLLSRGNKESCIDHGCIALWLISLLASIVATAQRRLHKTHLYGRRVSCHLEGLL